MKVQLHSSLKLSLEYYQEQTSLTNRGLITIFLTNLGVTETLYSFRLVLGEKTGKKIPESSRLEFL